MPNDYPIVVIDIPSPQEIAELCKDGALEALARAIAESIRHDLQFARESDIIEIPALEEAHERL